MSFHVIFEIKSLLFTDDKVKLSCCKVDVLQIQSLRKYQQKNLIFFPKAAVFCISVGKKIRKKNY